MLLKSSSTPVLGSLLPSFSDSPNNNNHHTPISTHPKIPCTTTTNNTGSILPQHSLKKPFFHSPSRPEPRTSAPFRRVQSEGNLDQLAGADDFITLPKKNPRRKTSCSTLEAIPSFSFRSSPARFDDSDDEEHHDNEVEEENNNSTRIESSVSERVRTDSNNVVDGYGGLRYEGKMYLATGLGVSGVKFVDHVAVGGGNGGGGGYRPVDFDRDGGDINMEDYYKRMMEANPGNALFMSNYAQFLYQKKRDLEGAEEYYSRAILADPKDGETLSQYAKLIWELHRDKERAANYFDRAVRASSEDSHVHAAYASFLWDTEEDNGDDDEEEKSKVFLAGQKHFRHGFMASATA